MTTSIMERMFQYKGSRVRTLVINGEPWFVAKDVCESLEIEDTGKAVARLDADESTRIEIDHPQSQFKKLGVIAVNEPGLYSLIIGSRKPEAKAFKRWITHEVIPAIRQTGSYSVGQPKALPRNYKEALEHLLDQVQENEQLIGEVKVLKPKAEKFDDFQNSDGYYYIGDCAKILNFPGMGQNLLFKFLRDLRILVKDFDNRSVPTQAYMKSGYFKVVPKEFTFFNKRLRMPETRQNSTTFVTPKGMDFIRNLLIKHGYQTAKKGVC